jgi:Zn-dependent peptidase ImmA (M78 family)
VVQIPLDDDEIDAFSSWDYHEEATPVIVLPSGKSGARLRLSVAHDVGHLALHPVPHKTAAEIEKEAFAFSAELLMPAAVMLHEIRRPVTLTTLAQLSPQWGVSVQALVRRARDLEIISQRQYTYLFEQIGALGWKRKEPIFIAAERPRAVRKIAELRYGDPPDYRRMASDANLPTKFIKALVEGHATR